MIMEYQWFEELPPSCPPFDSVECNGTYFRVSYGNPAESEDFFSQKRLAPNKVFKGEGIDDCREQYLSFPYWRMQKDY